MIEKRHKTFVTSNGLVPVDLVCGDIATGHNMQRLISKYPFDQEDVIDCIKFYATNTVVPEKEDDKLLDLINVGNNDEIVIEITKLHEIVYIKLLNLCLEYYPSEINFNAMVNHALRISCLNILDLFEHNEELTDPIDKLVHSSLQRNIPTVLVDVEKTRDDLDYDEFVEARELARK